MSNPFKPLFEFMGTEEFKTAFEQFKASKEPKEEWEIVWYKYKPTGTMIKNDGCIGWDIAKEGDKNYCIHSVRRLSDGEMFTVGDRLQNYTNPITEITMQGWVDGIGFNCGEYGEGCSLSRAKKLPAPLFTTLDGKEIHEGDEFYWASGIWNAEGPIIGNSLSPGAWGNEKTFSTREAAETYILNHRPLLSLNDVVKAYNDLPWTGITGLLDKLTNLVKSKLNP